MATANIQIAIIFPALGANAEIVISHMRAIRPMEESEFDHVHSPTSAARFTR
jgi:hypothetical protein